MPSCSSPGCSNRSHKGPEKRLSVHNLTFSNTKSWQKSQAGQLRRNARFMTKHLRMSTFVMNTSQGIVTKSGTNTKCWVQRQERGIVFPFTATNGVYAKNSTFHFVFCLWLFSATNRFSSHWHDSTSLTSTPKCAF